MSGYRVAPAPHTDVEDLCDACRGELGKIVLEHRHVPPFGHERGCEGLQRKPIIATLLNIPRRNAKTHSVLSNLAARIFLKANQRWAFLASAEDQADVLLDEKLVRPLSRPELGLVGHFELDGTKLIVPYRNSWIEVLPSTHGSITGRGNTGAAIDECRDVKARTVAAVAGTIFDAHGWECPKCARQWKGEEAPAVCPKDSRPLERWYGRLVFASSSGIREENDDKDWFDNAVKARLAHPIPEAHVFSTDRIINPSVSVEIVDAAGNLFSDVPGLSEFMAVEVSNKSLRRGEVFLRPEDVSACVDRKGVIVDRDESDRAAVWFLDTSDKSDLTTLAVLVDDAREAESPLERIALQHLKVWDPNDRMQCPNGVIDEDEIAEYLERIHGRFTRLRRAAIDTRGRPWAISLLARCAKESWARRIESYAGKQVDDDAGFEALHDYVLERRILIPKPKGDDAATIKPGMDPHARLLRELPALKKVDRGARGGFSVVDPNADKRGRNRNRKGLHRDVAAAVAGAALLAWEERKKLAISTDNSRVHAVNEKGRVRVGRRGTGIWGERS